MVAPPVLPHPKDLEILADPFALAFYLLRFILVSAEFLTLSSRRPRNVCSATLHEMNTIYWRDLKIYLINRRYDKPHLLTHDNISNLKWRHLIRETKSQNIVQWTMLG